MIKSQSEAYILRPLLQTGYFEHVTNVVAIDGTESLLVNREVFWCSSFCCCTSSSRHFFVFAHKIFAPSLFFAPQQQLMKQNWRQKVHSYTTRPFPSFLACFSVELVNTRGWRCMLWKMWQNWKSFIAENTTGKFMKSHARFAKRKQTLRDFHHNSIWCLPSACFNNSRRRVVIVRTINANFARNRNTKV